MAYTAMIVCMQDNVTYDLFMDEEHIEIIVFGLTIRSEVTN